MPMTKNEQRWSNIAKRPIVGKQILDITYEHSDMSDENVLTIHLGHGRGPLCCSISWREKPDWGGMPMSEESRKRARGGRINVVGLVAIIAGTLTTVIVTGLLVMALTRDTWERDNAYGLIAMVGEADFLEKTDQRAAYKKYDKALQEADGHVIEDERLRERLGHAREMVEELALRPEVQEALEWEATEQQRQEQARLAAEREQARRAAERASEQQRLEQARLATERAEARRAKEEEGRRREAKSRVRRYADVSQSARDALNIVKKVEARTEVGISYVQYMEVVGQAWGDMRVLVESPEGKDLWELSFLLMVAVQDYKKALDMWQEKLDTQSPTEKANCDELLQLYWQRAAARIRQAESLLDPAKCESVLYQIDLERGGGTSLIPTRWDCTMEIECPHCLQGVFVDVAGAPLAIETKGDTYTIPGIIRT